MDGYAVTMRIEPAAPRRRQAGATTDDPGEIMFAPLDELPEIARPAVQDVRGRDVAADLIDLLADIREVVRQGREVLADPQGWR